MKADTANRTNQLRSMVEQMMTKQGKKIGQADDIWSFLASGKYNVSPEVRAQAQKDIADDGYWGVEQTSDRIVEFAKALSGGDSEKADEMIAAFKKGFDQASRTDIQTFSTCPAFHGINRDAHRFLLLSPDLCGSS